MPIKNSKQQLISIVLAKQKKKKIVLYLARIAFM